MSPEEICSHYNHWIIVRRWAATWLDLLLLSGLLCGLFALFPSEQVLAVPIGVWLLVLALYYPLLEGLTGRTFGKFLCGLKVVDARGATPGVWKGIQRTALRLLELNLLLVGGVPAGVAVFSSRSRQRFGDQVAHTYVLRSEDLVALAPRPAIGPEPAGRLGDAPGVVGLVPPIVAGAVPPVVAGPVPPLPFRRPNPLPATNGAWLVPGAIVVTLFAAAAIIGGIHASKAAEQAHQPMTISCAGLLRSLPSEGWYHVTGCHYTLDDATYLLSADSPDEESDSDSAAAHDKRDKRVTDVFVPVYATEDHDGAKTSLLLWVDDPATCRLVHDLSQQENVDKPQRTAWIKAHLDQLIVNREITGMIRHESDLPLLGRDQLTRLQKKELRPDYVVLKEGDTPSNPAAIADIVAGVFVGLIAALFWLVALISFADRRAGG